MKRIIFILLLFFISFNVYASEKIEVKFSKCVDGDTAWLIKDEKEIKVRFLAIDAPEVGEQEEPFGKEASEFTCNKLKYAKKIEIEYDDNALEKDKYERHLVWIFVDDRLLQDEIVRNGWAEVTYLYGDYKYIDRLKQSESIAKRNSLNIWSNNDDYKEAPIILVVLIFIIVIYFIVYKIRKENKRKQFKKENKENKKDKGSKDGSK
jgi:micrococcal nuclease